MKVIFVVGPYRATSYENRWRNCGRAKDAALMIWHMGAAVICPHLNTMDFNNHGEFDEAVFLNGYREIVSRCDAIYTVTGAEDSEGSLAEIDKAFGCSIPVFNHMKELEQFICQG